MKKILIVSATSGSNLILAKKIGELFGVKNEIITLEDYELPLYSRNIKLKSDICLAKVEQTSSHLGFIVDKVETASAMNTSIATAAEEQSVVVTGINQNVNAMSELMVETTENGNELAGASAKLLSFTEEMNTMTEQFKVS